MQKPTGLQDLVAKYHADLAGYKTQTVEALNKVVETIYASGDGNNISRLQTIAERLNENPTGLAAKLEAINNVLGKPSETPVRITYRQAQTLWEEHDSKSGNPATKGAYKERIRQAIQNKAIKAEKTNGKISLIDKGDLITYIAGYSPSKRGYSAIKPAERKSTEKVSTKRGESLPAGKYVSQRVAWKQLKQYEISRGLEVVSDGAYGNRVRAYIESGKLPAKGKGRERKVHQRTLTALKEKGVRKRPVKKKSVRKTTPKAPKVEKGPSRFDEVKSAMSGRDASAINTVLDELKITGRERSGYRVGYLSHIRTARPAESTEPAQATQITQSEPGAN